MTRLSVNVFCGLSILVAGQPASCSSAKVTELLGYLLIHRDRPQARETLAGVLWPDHSAPASVRHLRHALRKRRCARQPEPDDFPLTSMRLHQLSGDRTAALRQFERCPTAMANEFGVGPSAATLALHDRLLADQAPDPAPKVPPQSRKQEPVAAGRSEAAGPVGPAGPAARGGELISTLHRTIRDAG